MFTGLIRHRGTIADRSEAKLSVGCPTLRAKLAHGDSVAVSGACLTVAKLTKDGFIADLLGETREQTTLGVLPHGAVMNLEPALGAGESLGGHFVQGHVDGMVRLLRRPEREAANWNFTFELHDWLKPFAVHRGSIAVDGVSLTIQQLRDDSFSVSVIPTTYQETTLGGLTVGDPVNIEADLIVKSVHHVLTTLSDKRKALDIETLRGMGYGS